MNTRFLFGAIVLGLAFLGYYTLIHRGHKMQIIDETYAIEVVKKALAISGPLTAKRLTGGLTGAQLFRVTGGKQEYVVRFASDVPKKNLEEYVYNSKVASDAGYGPHVYFTDLSQGLMIMKYLPDNPISLKDLQSERFSVLLADLLRKIHQGPAFGNSVDIFDLVLEEIGKMKDGRAENALPLAQLESIVRIIQKTALARVKPVPSHNDLHPQNLIFLGDSFKAIDFEVAAQSNPYFDIARLAIFSGFNPLDEKRLLANYFKREPSMSEQRLLYLMNQIALISTALAFLASASEIIDQYESLQVPAYGEFLIEVFAGKIDLGNPENRLKFAKTMVNLVLADTATQEFRDAVNLLS